jgi:WhiB family redox-sensing transcriptional regulator
MSPNTYDRPNLVPLTTIKMEEWQAANDLSEANLRQAWAEASAIAEQRQKSDILRANREAKAAAKAGGVVVANEAGPEDWRLKAKCFGIDPDLFFPEDGAGVELAQDFCADCPVKEPCLNYAIKKNIDHGVWGGESERGRRRIKRQRRAEAKKASENVQ